MCFRKFYIPFYLFLPVVVLFYFVISLASSFTFEGRSNAKIEKAHVGPVTSMISVQQTSCIATGGKDGKVRGFTFQFKYIPPTVLTMCTFYLIYIFLGPYVELAAAMYLDL